MPAHYKVTRRALSASTIRGFDTQPLSVSTYLHHAIILIYVIYQHPICIIDILIFISIFREQMRLYFVNTGVGALSKSFWIYSLLPLYIQHDTALNSLSLRQNSTSDMMFRIQALWKISCYDISKPQFSYTCDTSSVITCTDIKRIYIDDSDLTSQSATIKSRRFLYESCTRTYVHYFVQKLYSRCRITNKSDTIIKTRNQNDPKGFTAFTERRIKL